MIGYDDDQGSYRHTFCRDGIPFIHHSLHQIMSIMVRTPSRHHSCLRHHLGPDKGTHKFTFLHLDKQFFLCYTFFFCLPGFSKKAVVRHGPCPPAAEEEELAHEALHGRAEGVAWLEEPIPGDADLRRGITQAGI